VAKALSQRLPGITKENHERPRDTRSPGQDLNLGPPEHEEMLTTRLRRSVIIIFK
jgi:hypothetical protein